MCRQHVNPIICTILITIFSIHSTYSCYVIAAGKDATADGSIIFGHVEQNYDASVLNFRFIPRRQFNSGSKLTLYRGGKLTHVPEVNALLWTQNIKKEFADGFMNEWGVGVYTNLCTAREKNPSLTDDGLGYFLRRLVAERAKTAREGVHVAGDLVEQFGYAAPTGRTLSISDPNEIWLFALCRGKHWLAARVPNNHAVAMPNTYIIREIDLQDTVNYLSSPNLIQYARNKGWYSSGTFIFTDVYGVGYTSSEYERQWKGQKALTKDVVPHGNTMPFSLKPDKKLTVKDVIAILREHDNHANQEIAIYQLRNNMPKEIGCVFWRTTAQGKYSVLTPWYAGITATPTYYCKNVSIEQQLTLNYNFSPPSGTFSYDKDLIWWEYKGLQDRVQNNTKGQTRVISVWSEFERRLFANQTAIEQTATSLFSSNKDSAISYLTEYCSHVAFKAKTIAEKMNKSWITGSNSSYCVALACAAPISGKQPLKVSFDGFLCSNRNLKNFKWDFGDGSNDTGSSPFHTYKDTGTFTAVLTAENDQGTTDKDSVKVTVDPGTVGIGDKKEKIKSSNHCSYIYNRVTNNVLIEYSTGNKSLNGTMKFCNLNGQVIKVIPFSRSNTNGRCQLKWNCIDNAGKPVSPGVYVCSIMTDTNKLRPVKIIIK